MPSAKADALAQLVAALPEVYQPVFGHPEYSAVASRGCEDRLAHVLRVYRAVASKLDRAPRVLDLGCAQGFFSLALAEQGATVVGIDFRRPNIALCNALCAAQPELKVRFELGCIEQVIARLQPGDYDLVLGLSVFHHTIHRFGLPYVKGIITSLAERTLAGLFEVALAGEPAEWARSQPQNPRELLEAYAFVHEIDRTATHLSAVRRPLYVASNRYWCLDGQAEAFDSWKAQSHTDAAGASCGTRRYFFGNAQVAKVLELDVARGAEANLREYENEVAFLLAPPPALRVPRLTRHGRCDRQAWLVRECLPGELLSERIRSRQPYDAKRVLLDILGQLAALQDVGLYHDDVRPWNILIAPDGHATLIDYGAINAAGHDCAWPHSVFLAFMISMHEIIAAKVSKPDPLRLPLLNPDDLPEPYRSVLWDLLEIPPDRWTFAFLRDRVADPSGGSAGGQGSSRAGVALLVQALQVSCLVYRAISRHSSGHACGR